MPTKRVLLTIIAGLAVLTGALVALVSQTVFPP